MQRIITLAAWGLLAALPAHAWDYEGHRTVNQLALAALPAEFPAFAQTPAARERIAWLAGEPDRWRNTRDLPFRHAADPEHYIDLEDLRDAGLNPDAVSEFRYVFLDQWLRARAAHPDRFPPVAPEKNKDHTRELPGFLPWAINESYAKLKSGFSCLKAYEEHGTPEEIAHAQAGVVYQMGMLGHLVGDAAQPLHTTKYFNGWFGKNPRGYTTSRTFHAWIDGGYLRKTGLLSLETLTPKLKPARLLLPETASARDPMFAEIFGYIQAQHEKVLPLYELEKSGRLAADGPLAPEARQFFETQFLSAAQLLADLWLTAWRTAPPDLYLRARLLERQTDASAPN